MNLGSDNSPTNGSPEEVESGIIPAEFEFDQSEGNFAEQFPNSQSATKKRKRAVEEAAETPPCPNSREEQPQAATKKKRVRISPSRSISLIRALTKKRAALFPIISETSHLRLCFAKKSKIFESEKSGRSKSDIWTLNNHSRTISRQFSSDRPHRIDEDLHRFSSATRSIGSDSKVGPNDFFSEC